MTVAKWNPCLSLPVAQLLLEFLSLPYRLSQATRLGPRGGQGTGPGTSGKQAGLEECLRRYRGGSERRLAILVELNLN